MTGFFHPLDGVERLEPPVRPKGLPAVPVRGGRQARGDGADGHRAPLGAEAGQLPGRAQAVRPRRSGTALLPHARVDPGPRPAGRPSRSWTSCSTTSTSWWWRPADGSTWPRTRGSPRPPSGPCTPGSRSGRRCGTGSTPTESCGPISGGVSGCAPTPRRRVAADRFLSASTRRASRSGSRPPKAARSKVADSRRAGPDNAVLQGAAGQGGRRRHRTVAEASGAKTPRTRSARPAPPRTQTTRTPASRSARTTSDGADPPPERTGS